MRFSLFILSLVAVAVAGFVMYEDVVTRPSGGEGSAVVEISKGDSVKTIASKLVDAGVMDGPSLFEIEARMSGLGGKLRAGEYLMPKNVSIRGALRTLVEGKVVLHRITIPEGLNIAQISEALEKSGLIAAMEFVEAAHNQELLREHGLSSATAEGYLFPETYSFSKGVKGRDAVSAMLKMFFAKAGPALPGDVMGDPSRLHELVTLASIVEKETGKESEKRLVAAVFTNRLRKNMPLQSDPTVIYSLPEFDGNIRKKDLSYDSPYNTYTRRGLPPGPIANPGLSSLLATLEPADVDYLYFVSKNNGEHHFSATLEEHNRAVRQFQLADKR